MKHVQKSTRPIDRRRLLVDIDPGTDSTVKKQKVPYQKQCITLQYQYIVLEYNNKQLYQRTQLITELNMLLLCFYHKINLFHCYMHQPSDIKHSTVVLL